MGEVADRHLAQREAEFKRSSWLTQRCHSLIAWRKGPHTSCCRRVMDTIVLRVLLRISLRLQVEMMQMYLMRGKADGHLVVAK